MTSFAVTTLITFAGIVCAGALLGGAVRVWVLIAIAGAYVVLFGLGVAFIRMQYFGRSICRGRAGNMRIALTFDDGPDPAATPALLDLLRREKIPAAFFCIGRQVRAHPQLAARIAAEGHLLGNHTYRHLWWTSLLRTRALTDEMLRTQEAIEQATGQLPAYFRPPVGLTNPHFPASLKQSRLTMVGWDVRPLDSAWSARVVIERVLRRARDGSIIVLHDGGAAPEKIVKIVTTVARELRARGFEFERLDRLIADSRVAN